MISRNEKFSYSCSLDFLSYLFLVSFIDVGPDFSSSIIRSSGQISESSGSVIRQLWKGASVCRGRYVLRAVSPRQMRNLWSWGHSHRLSVLLSTSSAAQPSSCHPLQFFNFPILWEVSSLREYWPACCSKAGGHQHLLYHLVDSWRNESRGGCFWGGSLSLPPGAPGPRSQCGYPPGVAGTNSSPFLTHSSRIKHALPRTRRECKDSADLESSTGQQPYRQQWVGGPAHLPSLPNGTCAGLPSLHLEGVGPSLPPAYSKHLNWSYASGGVQTSLSRQGPQRTERVIKI